RSYDPLVVSFPEEMLTLLTPEQRVVVIDELQFFQEGIVGVVKSLLVDGLNIIGAGLDTNFRGEPFGYMPHLIGIASEVQKYTAVCEVEGCNKEAPLTQRLIDGEPAPYDSPEILVGDKEEGYEPRCLQHHEVPILAPS
ncbi:MAG: thymidine kinase, partial [Candidatus Woesearchaeota archaeon]|nr:thymidine kinase [Candidatus Woesearchaeota archaeon]